MLEVKELLCGYEANKPIIGPLTFSVAKGEIVCLLGPNGIGKTTLFKTILGVLKAQSGSISVLGKDYRDYTTKEFAQTVAYVPQGHIPPFPYLVEDVVVMGCNPAMHELSSPGKKELAIALEALDKMGIVHLAKRDYTQISGGERQMVMIARALAQNTNLLIMDEPTAHLDYGNENRVLEQIKMLAKRGYTIIMITHVPNHAFLCADKVLIVGKNNYFEMGKPSEILTSEMLFRLYDMDIYIADIVLDNGKQKTKTCVPMMK